MLHFLLAVPEDVLHGCAILIAVTFGMSVALRWQTWLLGSRVRVLTKVFAALGGLPSAQHRNGLSLGTLDEMRSRCAGLDKAPRGWWRAIDSHIEQYTSAEDVEGWFLTDEPRNMLPYENVIGNNFHSADRSSMVSLNCETQCLSIKED
jgi:hypothetical protein